MENWTIVEVLRHSRHDWMNKLQLIKGNLALNKIDQVERVLEEIIMEAHQESKLSNLKMPFFEQLLLTFNWEHHHFQIEYEVLDENGTLQEEDQVLFHWMKSFLEALDNSAAPFEDNHLSISFGTFDHRARFFFDFSGTIKDTETIADWIKQQKTVRSAVDLKGLSKNGFSLEVTI